MTDLTKILLSISAACMIAIGTGIVTFIPYIMDYEKEGYQMAYQVRAELNTNVEFLEMDCTTHKPVEAKCGMSKHMIKTSISITEALLTVAKHLLVYCLLSIALAFLSEILFKDKNKSTD